MKSIRCFFGIHCYRRVHREDGVDGGRCERCHKIYWLEFPPGFLENYFPEFPPNTDIKGKPMSTPGKIYEVKAFDPGAINQLTRIAIKKGYERVWSDPDDSSRWFAERRHPTDPGKLQAIPLDDLI